MEISFDKVNSRTDDVATVVPEFGTITMMILAVSIVSIIAVTARSKISLKI